MFHGGFLTEFFVLAQKGGIGPGALCLVRSNVQKMHN